uniref:Uncharacterized protein n=1 Tax=Entomoneis paludosa TaxID=265537 RepID=A0A7S2VBB6_9STRA
MDVIWKNLSDNHPSCKRLALYSQSDPGTGATFAVRCNSLMGVTSEENFLNDAMYLVEGVLPLNETLQSVEMEWSFLSHLEEEDRDSFIRGVASLKNLEEISIRGSMTEESRMRFRTLLQIPECAKKLKHLAIEVDELHVDDPAELGLAALLFLRCQHLESFHVRGLMPAPESETRQQAASDFDCSILLSALGKLPTLHTVHISRNQENPKTVSASALRDLCSLPSLQSLSLMNMGLTDKHCKIFKKTLYNSQHVHSLILVDNPAITEKGNKALLRLLEKNRSIYNSTFGTDSETIHRTSQLVHLHLNRCGRAKVQAPTNMPTWMDYLSKINETVPEELELDTLFLAVQENPEMIVQHCAKRDEMVRQHQLKQAQAVPEPKVTEPLEPVSVAAAVLQEEDDEEVVEEETVERVEQAKVAAPITHQPPKKLPTRKDIAVLNAWESPNHAFPTLLTSHSLDSSIMSPQQPYQQYVQPLPMQELDQLVQRWQQEAADRQQQQATQRQAQRTNLAEDLQQGHQQEQQHHDSVDSCNQNRGPQETAACGPAHNIDPPEDALLVSVGQSNCPLRDKHASPQATCPEPSLEMDEKNLPILEPKSEQDPTSATTLTQRQPDGDTVSDVAEGWAELERITNEIFRRLLDESCWVAPSNGSPMPPRKIVV